MLARILGLRLQTVLELKFRYFGLKLWLKSCRLSPSTSILSKCPIRKEMKRALFTWILRYVKKTSLGHIAGFVKLRGVAMYCSCRSYLCHFLPRGKVSCPHCFQSCESRAFSNLMDVILPDVSPTGAVPPTPIRLGSCEKKRCDHFSCHLSLTKN